LAESSDLVGEFLGPRLQAGHFVDGLLLVGAGELGDVLSLAVLAGADVLRFLLGAHQSPVEG